MDFCDQPATGLSDQSETDVSHQAIAGGIFAFMFVVRKTHPQMALSHLLLESNSFCFVFRVRLLSMHFLYSLSQPIRDSLIFKDC